MYRMCSKGFFLYSLRLLCKDIGVTKSLVLEPSGDKTYKHVNKHKLVLPSDYLKSPPSGLIVLSFTLAC